MKKKIHNEVLYMTLIKRNRVFILKRETDKNSRETNVKESTKVKQKIETKRMGQDKMLIHCNQIGYQPMDKKIAIVIQEQEINTFQIINEKGEKVYEGEVSEAVECSTAQEMVRYAEFSELKEEGRYQVRYGKNRESYPFTIREDVYHNILSDVFWMFYYQRCGQAITQGRKEFHHHQCHGKPARIYGKEEWIDVSGGWHDAGDYGRYVVAAAKAIADLLLVHELYGDKVEKVNHQLAVERNINLLAEVRYELDWLFKMQRADGGVYHKVTTAVFPEMIMPEMDLEEEIVSPVSTTATADFAAAMAMAYKSYKQVDSQYAERCLQASIQAWKYLTHHPECQDFVNPKDILTGEYGDIEDKDERYWASAALYWATGDSCYLAEFKEKRKEEIPYGYGWGEVGSYGTLLYLLAGEELQEEQLKKRLLEEMETKGQEIMELQQKNGYLVSLGEEYRWGSNMDVANDGMHLLFTSILTGKEEYRLAAKENLNYLLGTNPVSYCFVTGNGTLSPTHVHHRICAATGQTIPGMLVGGPDAGLHDDYAREILQGEAPAKCYIDHTESYSTNEITIYWNSPLLLLIAGCIIQE